MKRIRQLIHDRPDGWREVIVRCPCGRVGRYAARWEDPTEVLAELMDRHRLEAPHCPHRQETIR